ncbi:MAG TPA: nucleic acid-binding protein [Methanomicrobiales archaeon]|nr:nucleic acid-binding protein [Methanomicrobiales archaeon]
MNGRKAGGPRPGQTFDREPARRVFAGELREVRLQFREGEDEKSPSFVLLPTGSRCNRIFLVGTLTEKDRRGDQNVFYHARISDPTGTFFLMAGSYQPEAMQQIARIEPPAFVAVIGKPNVFESQTGSFLVSVRAESVTAVDRETRDLWVLDAARATLQRLDELGNTEDSKRAQEQYHPDPAVYRKMVYDALAQLKI